MKHLYIILSILFLLLYNVGYSQSEIYGEIKYTYSTNFSFLYTENYVMKFNDSISYSLETDIESSNDKNLSSSDKEGVSNTVIIGRKNIEPKYFYKNKNHFFFKDNYYNEIMIVEEEKQIWNWELTNETTQIGQFTCHKATTRFRGRNYTAWYTNEIPLPYGPWKLNGLPGVILEAYDDEGVFQMYATKVLVESNSKNKINFDSDELENSMTIKEYSKRRVALVKAEFARLSSKLPKGSKPIEYNENCKDCREQVEYFYQN